MHMNLRLMAISRHDLLLKNEEGRSSCKAETPPFHSPNFWAIIFLINHLIVYKMAENSEKYQFNEAGTLYIILYIYIFIYFLLFLLTNYHSFLLLLLSVN